MSQRRPPPLGGPDAVLDFLSLYTHRTSIAQERMRLRVRAKDRAGRPHGKRSIAVDGVQFVARLLQHVVPVGFKRNRHYGLLASGTKAARLAQARPLLQMVPPNP